MGGGYSISELSIISAAAFHAEQQRIDVYKLQYKETLAKGARLMSRAAFLSGVFKAAYRELFKHHIPDYTIKKIQDATNKAWVLADNRFKVQIEKQTN